VARGVACTTVDFDMAASGANGTNGANGANGHTPREASAQPPTVVAELAEACVRFVERATGVLLDYTPDTLSLLDHYTTAAAVEAKGKPEALDLVARAAAAYFGEVVRRRYDAWWWSPGDDIAGYEVRFGPIYLSLSPYLLACSALGIEVETEDGFLPGIVIDAEELDDIGLHLEKMPPVPEDEFVLPTTRWDVIEIVVDQLKARAEKRGLGDVTFDDRDYEG
jgi:hypothetical protein